jgi:hypothetical protein
MKANRPDINHDQRLPAVILWDVGRETVAYVPLRGLATTASTRWGGLADPAHLRCVQKLGRNEHKGVVMT